MSLLHKEFDFCLLIPCYDNFDGLLLSLETVNYYSDRVMIVIVDDGSKIPITVVAIKSVIKTGYPLIVVRNDMNNGITDALNKGLRWIQLNTEAKYVARLDCGDLCHADRFYKQIDYMNNHSDTGLLGSWCVFENKDSSFKYRYKAPTEHEPIKRAMHFRNVFIHPTVIFKTDLLEKIGYYPYDFDHAEDYAFFWELLKITRSHILNEFLVTCEINEQGISLKNRQTQMGNQIRIISKYGTNPILKIIGLLRIKVLRLLPKRFILPLKTLIKQQ
jgi:glycosyltransferase involved in cell wall biosynthesis